MEVTQRIPNSKVEGNAHRKILPTISWKRKNEHHVSFMKNSSQHGSKGTTKGNESNHKQRKTWSMLEKWL